MSDLIYFPEPYPDEDYRSLIYRYHIRSPNVLLADSIYELFGKKSSKLTLFPNKLEGLLEKLPIGYSCNINNLLTETTWIGLIKAFMSKEQRNEFERFIRFGTENSFFIYSKIPANFFTGNIKYCPACLKADYIDRGECYVHKKHQIIFMDFCDKHSEILIDKCPICHVNLTNAYSTNLLTVPFCKNGHDLTKNSRKVSLTGEKMLKSELFNLLCIINENWQAISAEVINHKILMALWKRNYIHYKGRVLKKELVESIKSNYEADFLEAISINTQHISHPSFTQKILLHNLNKNIMFYLVLIHHLFNSYKDFIEFKYNIANPIPFGLGPWKCLNKTCFEYNRNIISKNKRIPKVSGGSVITVEFTCPVCGYTYVKRWHVNKDKKDKVMIKTMGRKWLEQLLELYLQGKSALQIATELNCSEFGVRQNLDRVIGNSNKLNIEERESVRQIVSAFLETASTDEFEVKKEKCRERVLNYIKSNQHSSRVEIQNENYSSYLWLKMNDKEWLESVLPIPITIKKVPIDLTLYDRELSVKIKKVSKKLYESYPYQIKKSTILKELSSIERSRIKKKTRLPLSELTLNSCIEQQHSYQIRRIPAVIDNMLKGGYKNITLESIKKMNKIYKDCDVKTELLIKDMLRERGFTE